MHPLVSFMITTRNRVNELVKTLASCYEQDWPSLEVLGGNIGKSCVFAINRTSG